MSMDQLRVCHKRVCWAMELQPTWGQSYRLWSAWCRVMGRKLGTGFPMGWGFVQGVPCWPGRV